MTIYTRRENQALYCWNGAGTMTRNNNPPVGLGLLVFGGVALVTGLIAQKLLGPNSPARIVESSMMDTYALILGVVMPVLAVLSILLYLWGSRQ